MCDADRGAAFAEKDGYAYVRCAECGFVFLDPMPDAATLARQYTNHDSGVPYAAAYPKAASRFRRSRLKAFRLARYIRGRDAIDIGCGGGFMVEAMRRVGARAVGLDINPAAIAYAERQYPENRFFCEDVGIFERRDLAFDFVYSSEVIEHVPDAQRYMALLARITRPGGHVYITTPDIGHWACPPTSPAGTCSARRPISSFSIGTASVCCSSATAFARSADSSSSSRDYRSWPCGRDRGRVVCMRQ